MSDKKVKVSVEYIRNLLGEIERINRLNFNDIVWTEGAGEFEPSDAQKETWTFIGLRNTSYIEVGAYDMDVEEVTNER